jgi:hypothetical protein
MGLTSIDIAEKSREKPGIFETATAFTTYIVKGLGLSSTTTPPSIIFCGIAKGDILE